MKNYSPLIMGGSNGDEDGGGVDGDPGGGTEEPTRGDSGGGSPLQSSPAAAFCLLFRGFVFLRRLLSRNARGPFL